jgi:hypothetical protein
MGGQPGLQSEFQDSQGYTEKPCLEKPKKKTCCSVGLVFVAFVFGPLLFFTSVTAPFPFLLVHGFFCPAL